MSWVGRELFSIVRVRTESLSTYLGVLSFRLEVTLDSGLDGLVENCRLWENGQFVGDQLASIVLLHDRITCSKLMVHLKNLSVR